MFFRICLVNYQEFLTALQLGGADPKNVSYHDKKAIHHCLLTKEDMGRHQYKRVKSSYKPVEGGEDPLDLAWKPNNKTVLPEQFLWTVLALLLPIFLHENQDRLSKLPPSKIKGAFIKFVGANYHFCHQWTEAHLLTTNGQTTVPESVPSTEQQQLLLGALMKATLEPAALLHGNAKKIVVLLQSAGLPAPPLAPVSCNADNNNHGNHSSKERVSLQIVPATSRPTLEESFSHLGLCTSYHSSHAPFGPSAASLTGPHGRPFPNTGAAFITGSHGLPFPHTGVAFTAGTNGLPLPNTFAHGVYAQNIQSGGHFNGLPTHYMGPLPADFVSDSSSNPHGLFLPHTVTRDLPAPMAAPPVNNNSKDFKLPPGAVRDAAKEVAQELLTHVMPVLEDVREGQNEVVAYVKASAKKGNDPPQQNDSAEDNNDEDTPQLISDLHNNEDGDDYDCSLLLDKYSETSQFTLTDEDITLLCNSSSDDVDAVLCAIDNREAHHPPGLSFDFISGSGTKENALATAVSSPSSAFGGHTITSKKWTQTSTGQLLYEICPAHTYQYVKTEFAEKGMWQTVPGVQELRLTLRVDGAVVVEHLDSKNQVIFTGNLVWQVDNKVAQKYTGRHPFTRSKQSVATMVVIQSKCLNAKSDMREPTFLYDFWEQSETDDVLKLCRESLLGAA